MQEMARGAVSGAAVIASVKWYDPVRGFGFLAPVDGSRDVFCHSSAVAHAGWLTLPEGATVTCEVVEGRQGRQVSQIHEIDASSATPERAGSGRQPHGERGPAPAEPAPRPVRRCLVASVKWFVATRGYGFLSPADGSADVFCHASVVADAGYERLPKGASVTCEVVEGRRGPTVSSIVTVDTSTALAAPAVRGGRRNGAPQQGRRDDGDDAPVEELPGVVKFYDAGKGFGFVVPGGGGPDVFLRASVLNRAGVDWLEPGRQVRVMVAQGVRGPQATDIELL